MTTNLTALNVTKLTKESAMKSLIAAGFAAEMTDTGIDVRGDGWNVHYDDRGQGWNIYNGTIPTKVEELAAWDDETSREN